MRFTSRIKPIVNQIDLFLDDVAEGGLLLKPALDDYMKKNKDEFAERLQKIRNLESSADKSSRTVETQLYTHSLLPDSRGDVLGLLENTDTILDTIKMTLKTLDIEKPMIPEKYHQDILELAQTCAEATDQLVLGCRAFFREVHAVNAHIHKVHFFEREADRIGERIKRDVFASGLDLAEKLHLRFTIEMIERVSDVCQDVATRLSIYSIKRMV